MSIEHDVVNDRIYITTTSGLDIYDVVSEEKIAVVSYIGGFSSVWINTNYVFVGTQDDGIKAIPTQCIDDNIAITYDLVGCLEDFRSFPYITSNNIVDLHGNSNKVICITDSGVDVIKYGPQEYYSYTSVSGGSKCFITSDNKCYYTINNDSVWSLNVVNSYLGDWAIPDKSYINDGTILESGVVINDFFITENTSVDGNSNVLFIATSNGVYVIDESDDSCIIYRTEE